MALKRYIKQIEKSRTACDMCSSIVFSQRFKFRPSQMVSDYIPAIVLVCKKCLYREITGSRGLTKRMSNDVLKDEGNA